MARRSSTELNCMPAVLPAAVALENFDLRSRGRQRVALELAAQVLLGELADGGLRNLVDEGDIVGQPPLGDLVAEPLEQLLFAEFLAGLHHDARQWAFRPLGMRD